MTIHLASDHAGFELKEKIKGWLKEKGYPTKDHGAFSLNPTDDYPEFIKKAAEAVSKHTSDRAIVLGGSGEGEAMVANRYKNVRAAVFYAPGVNRASPEGGKADPFEIVKLSRRHNDANVLSLGARFIKEDDALEAIRIWLETPFEGGRHERRLKEF